MTKETLERLLNEACELLIIFEDGGVANEEEKAKIAAIFDEIKYSDKIDEEMSNNDEEMSNRRADDEAQDWEIFGKGKV